MTDQAGPGPRRIHDHPGGDRPLVCFHANNPARRNLNTGHLDIVETLHSQTLRRTHITHDHAVRVDQAIIRIIRPCQGIFKTHQGQASMNFVRGQPFGMDAQALLQLQAVPKDFNIIGFGKNEKITAFAEVDLLADLVLETIEHR